ncbi:MAG TPA: acyltransferase [Clostridia bacterium]
METVYWGNRDKIHLENNVYIPEGATFNTNSGEIWIDEDTFAGHEVKILAGGHDYTKFGHERAVHPTEGYDIRIGKGVWLGSFCIIVGPVTIGDYAVIGAGAVVTKNVPAYTVVAGNPARIIKSIEH